MGSFRCFLFVISALLCASSWSQATNETLPDVSELLAEVTKIAATTDDGYLLKEAACLYARVGEQERAYELLGKSGYERSGFLDLVKAIALYTDTDTAMRIVQTCPARYQAHAKAAYGTVALEAARRGDTEGARRAIQQHKRIKKADAVNYPYELYLCVSLDDKQRGRELLTQMRDKANLSKPTSFMSREMWAGTLWSLSLYQWCGMTDEFDEMLNWAAASMPERKKARAEILKMLETELQRGDENKTAAKPITTQKIQSYLVKAESQTNPKGKAKWLIAAADKVLQFGKPVMDDGCQ